MFERRAQFLADLFLLVFLPASALALNPEGSSTPLIARICEACRDGSTCGVTGQSDRGLCDNGDVCLPATCGDR
jgi:hypothetical protein